MGSARRFNLSVFGCDVFFETGTGTGESLVYAASYPSFTKLFSVEIHKPTADAARKFFAKDDRVTIINSESAQALESYLVGIPTSTRILFFLDAHFPGEVSPDFEGYKKSEPIEVKLPLRSEIDVISRMRPDCNDLIICDDLRIYEDGPFQNGNMPAWAQVMVQEDRGIDFINEAFPDRDIVRLYYDEGYVIVEGKDAGYG